MEHAEVIDKEHVAGLLVNRDAVPSAGREERLHGLLAILVEAGAAGESRDVRRTPKEGGRKVDLHLSVDVVYGGPVENLDAMPANRFCVRISILRDIQWRREQRGG